MSEITFDFRADPSKVTFVVTWGDGTIDTYNNKTRNPPAILHRYAADGTYVVSITVNDGLGLPTSVTSASQDVTVQPDQA